MWHKWLGTDNGLHCFKCGVVVDEPDTIDLDPPPCYGPDIKESHHLYPVVTVGKEGYIDALECSYCNVQWTGTLVGWSPECTRP